MLALKVEYLTGVSMATAHDDPSRSMPEWPPHPDRLYSALVAAAAHLPDASNGHLPQRAQEALTWLAAQCWGEEGVVAPHLYTSEAYSRLAPDVHMPSNPHPSEIPKKLNGSSADNLKKLRDVFPVHRKKTALPIPAVVSEEPAVYFIWKSVDANDHLDSLRDICEQVTYLGRSRSLVRVSLVDDPPEPTHAPDARGQVQLRVPGKNRLRKLMEFHERKGGKPDPSGLHRYRCFRDESRKSEIIPSVFERMYVFRPRAGDPTIPAIATLKITQTLRRALIACTEAACKKHGLKSRVPDVVHGHGADPHCAYVALPFVHARQRHADGTLKGLAVLVPRSASQNDLMALALGLGELQQNGLGISGIGTWHLEEVPEDAPPLCALATATWQGPSRRWVTATPMEFGHFPKPSNGGEAKVVLDSVRMAGVDPDRVVEIAVGRHSPLHGASPSWHFKPRSNDSDNGAPRRLLRHVTLLFDRPVAGPLLLGAKRYFGLGLMYPLRGR